ncbi:MAG: hypothetical protein JO199_05935 [Candidatus Eremiobacteraeota bacterium]|nr:hypothetical protein [Candidatus Eremiobacteraeota bacterium]
MEKANLQQMALALALNSCRPPSAVLGAKGEVYYVHPKFAELTSGEGASDDRWWREPGRVTLASGESFTTSVRRLDGGLILVSFEG